MITGKPAFPEQALADLIIAHQKRPPERLKNPLDPVLQKALAKDRTQRYGNMEEFGRAIDGATRPSGRWLAFAAAAAIVFLTAIAFTPWLRQQPATPSGEIVALTSFTGEKDFLSFSPDAKEFVFSWRGPANLERFDIYTKVVGEGEPVRLTQTPSENETISAWSPDGRSIAYLAQTPDVRLRIIPARGGTVPRPR